MEGWRAKGKKHFVQEGKKLAATGEPLNSYPNENCASLLHALSQH